MSDITKRVDRGIPPLARHQTFTQADASEGDILKIKSSLGHAAANMIITTDEYFEFRLNVYQYVMPKKVYQSVLPLSPVQSIHTTSGEYLSTGHDTIVLTAGESLEFSNDLQISDLQIAVASGNWDIWVS